MGLKHIFLAMILTLAGGCGEPAEPVQPDPPAPAGPPPEVVSFTYTHSGSMTDSCYEYTAEKTEEGTRLHLEGLFSGGWLVDEITQDPVLEELSKVVETWNLLAWDGFDQVNSMVLDGEGFSLSITLADGRTVSAHGSNAFPDNHSQAAEAFRTIFEPYLNRAPGPEYLAGTWQMAWGIVEGMEYTAEESGMRNTLTIRETGAGLTADLLDERTDIGMVYARLDDLSVTLLEGPLYSGCGNEVWHARLGPEQPKTERGAPVEPEYYVTLIAEDTLLREQYYELDGSPMVSHQYYQRVTEGG